VGFVNVTVPPAAIVVLPGVKQPYAQLLPLVVIDTVVAAGAAWARAIGPPGGGGATVVVVVEAMVVLVVVVDVSAATGADVLVATVVVLAEVDSAAIAVAGRHAEPVTASASAAAAVSRRIIEPFAKRCGRRNGVVGDEFDAPAGLRQRRLRCDTNPAEESFDRAGRSFR
jgi:hypothetical protein